uniref:Uncharacterized protein n=1 Tax=viral metagenome TaxID=1070528 RepID=A0A6C0DBJ0_9ZZZZ
MSHNHAFQIEKLRNNFENIITLKKEIAKVKMLVSDKLSQLKLIYNELIKTNNKKIFLFCLDSFYFQYKTFAMEMEHIDRYRALMNNRMYCDYYKLYNLIITHIKDNRADMNVAELELKSYPAYKDLEPFQEYKLEDIKEIHNNILFLINQLYGQTLDKNDTIEHYNDNHKIGFSISNFLNTLEYENRLLREQVGLYINYVSFFHISERKQLNRLYLRMQEFYTEIEENININRTFSIDDIGDEDKLNRFYIIGEDVKIDPILEDVEFLETIKKETKTIEVEPLIEIDESNKVNDNVEETSNIVENPVVQTESSQPENIDAFEGMTSEINPPPQNETVETIETVETSE